VTFEGVNQIFLFHIFILWKNMLSTVTVTVKHKKKVKWSHHRPSVAQRVGRGIALLFHDRGTRRGWVVSSMPWLHFTPRKDPVPILQEAGCAPGPVWMGRKSRPHRNSIPDRPAHSQSLYWLSYLAHPVKHDRHKMTQHKTCDTVNHLSW